MYSSIEIAYFSFTDDKVIGHHAVRIIGWGQTSSGLISSIHKIFVFAPFFYQDLSIGKWQTRGEARGVRKDISGSGEVTMNVELKRWSQVGDDY